MRFRNDKKDNNLPAQVVPLLPLRGLVVFPHEVYPIFVGRHKSIKALEEAESPKNRSCSRPRKTRRCRNLRPTIFTRWARWAWWYSCSRLPDGTVKALLEGKKRARILRHVSDREFFQVEVEEVAEVLRAHHRSRSADALRHLDL